MCLYVVYNFVRCRMNSSSKAAWISDSYQFSSSMHPRSDRSLIKYKQSFFFFFFFFFLLCSFAVIQIFSHPYRPLFAIYLCRSTSHAGSRTHVFTVGRGTLRIYCCGSWGRSDMFPLLCRWSSPSSSGPWPPALQPHCEAAAVLCMRVCFLTTVVLCMFYAAM